jgi:hypothetical protein
VFHLIIILRFFLLEKSNPVNCLSKWPSYQYKIYFTGILYLQILLNAKLNSRTRIRTRKGKERKPSQHRNLSLFKNSLWIFRGIFRHFTKSNFSIVKTILNPKLQRAGLYLLKIDLIGLNSGIYFIRFTSSSEGTRTIPFMVVI